MGRDLLKAISQLRMYTIKEGKMAEWVDGWTRGVLPLRRKFGFRVDGAWVVPEGNRFIWILSYDGPEGFEARDSAYYDSLDRKSTRSVVWTTDPQYWQFLRVASVVSPVMWMCPPHVGQV